MNKRLLIIGATGLLGEPVARRLKKKGFSVRIMLRDIQIETMKGGKKKDA